MATSADLKFYYGGAASDGAAFTEYTVDSATANTITDAALTQADDYWKGAILRFEDDTTTAALRGLEYPVTDFVASSDTITVGTDFADTVVAGDTYRLIRHWAGNYRSSQEVEGLNVTAGPSNVTGVTLDLVSHLNGEGNGTLAYTNATDTVTWTPPGGSAGASVDVSSNGTYDVFGSDTNKFIRITVVSASLPGTDQSDTITTDYVTGNIIPNVQGDEASAGALRHYLIVAYAAAALSSIKAYITKRVSTAAATTTAGAKDTTAGALSLTDATNWPTVGWVHNTTKSDCAPYYNRSGNTLTLLSRADVCKLAFDTGSTVFAEGDSVTGGTSGATATVMGFQVNTGTWGGGDAAGYLYLKDWDGTSFQNNEALNVSGQYALADGSETAGHRDYTATSWDSGDAVELMPDYDIAIEAPSSDQYATPTTPEEAPDNATFTAPTSSTAGLSIGDLASAEAYGVWVRVWVPVDARAVSEMAVPLRLSMTV